MKIKYQIRKININPNQLRYGSSIVKLVSPLNIDSKGVRISLTVGSEYAIQGAGYAGFTISDNDDKNTTIVDLSLIKDEDKKGELGYKFSALHHFIVVKY